MTDIAYPQQGVMVNCDIMTGYLDAIPARPKWNDYKAFVGHYLSW
jgi:hypothetical protein